MRIHWLIRTTAFMASCLTLSLFFAGWRGVMEEGHIVSGGFVLFAGVVLTALTLILHGYWIYFEEKQKGTLRRHIGWYEKLHSFIDGHCASHRALRLIQPVLTLEKGNNE